MSEWWLKGKKKLEDKREEVRRGCAVGAAGLFFLTPQERQEVKEKCIGEVENASDEVETECVTEIEPKRILKGRRYSSCVTKKFKKKSVDPFQFTYNEGLKVLNRRQTEEVQVDKSQALKDLREFTYDEGQYSLNEDEGSASADVVDNTTVPIEGEFKKDYADSIINSSPFILDEGGDQKTTEMFKITKRTEKAKAEGIFYTPKGEKGEDSLIIMKAKVQCKDCEWITETENLKVAKTFRRKEFSCPICKSTHLKIKNAFPYKMRRTYFKSENEVRYATMNALFDSVVRSWDCQSEKHLCYDPIFLGNIPMRILTGDFPFFWNERYYITEVKFDRFGKCKLNRKRYIASRGGVMIYDDQSKMILRGEGILLVVAEPTPKVFGRPGISGESESECENFLEREWRIPLGKNSIPYEVVIMNQKMFKRYWNQYLEKKTVRVLGHKLYRYFNFREAIKLEPKCYHQLFIKDFFRGKIADLILNLVRNER